MVNKTRVSLPPDERKEEIINSAWHLFYEKGYSNVTIKDVIKDLHIVKGTFYYHFKNKEGFLIFKDFAQYHISNEIMDFGFIFQSLKKDKFILNVPHLQFVEWLFKNNFINQKINDEIDIRKGFASIKKLSSEARQNSYLKLKEKYLE